ncbi:MAG TPA: HD domain-containing phosphohydrolase, partial [Anaerolineales bacterium]|nr:HD domain-containing phosphohydrolase [Anaerolineales bacterium]
ISRIFRPQKLFRSQIIAIAIGFLIPVVVSVLALFDIHIAPQRDATPFTFAIGNLIVAWGLFRYHLFEVAPVARDTVVENMGDPVIVVDLKNRIIDMNAATAQSLGITPAQAIGRPASEVFSEWEMLTRMFTGTLDLRTDVSMHIDGRVHHYQVHISPLRDRRARTLGRVFVLNDVTDRVELQAKLESLNEELERRVQERTEELRKSAESYRAVVENQTEFIVRWKPEGTRTFANEAYRRYFGLTPEQAVSSGFMPLIVEEDRRAVEEKIARLRSGLVQVETETHRVIKPDGSIGWQEWTDQAILNNEGEIIEFQSVGRDITERKRAEENLAEAYDITLQGWAKALELRDKETEGHSRRVTELTLELARASGVAAESLDNIRRGAILHDIGKMSIPDEILRKPGPLTEAERQIVQKHPLVAYELLSPIRYLQNALEIPYCHHEKWDGSGYPRGLKGEQIPLAARIFAVADVWDAVQSDRPYNKGWSRQRATEYLQEQSGLHFDPRVVNTFIGLIEQGKI